MINYQTFDSGVHLDATDIQPNHQVEITYNGLLARSGAQEVYVHYGSSYLKDWVDIQDLRMSKNPNNTFSTSITIPQGNTFHVCFHDNAYNWDNNSGQNYSYKIHK